LTERVTLYTRGPAVTFVPAHRHTVVSRGVRSYARGIALR